MEAIEIEVKGVKVKTTVADSATKVDAFIGELRSMFSNNIGKMPVVGIAVEPGPPYVTNNKIPILQLCVGNLCLIIQLLHLDSVPQSLKQFLNDHNIFFVGVNIEDQALPKFNLDYGLHCETVFELDQLATKLLEKSEFCYYGLPILARQVCGLEIDKPITVVCSNWGSRTLTNEQIKYATFDAYASYLIGFKLLQGC